MKKLISISLFLLPLFILSQENFTAKTFADYSGYQEKSLSTRRFKHADIQPLIEGLKKEPGFGVKKLGTSIEGRSISMISLGTGKVTVLLWSQMHGDESTATMAIFDLMNYFKSNKTLLNKVNLHFIPMLNPDGAEQFNRRNAIGIDINRDAVRLQSPESRILKAVTR
ncbi:MAG: M14 family zinc carboxypeptidase [Flavobacteriaceae bacterium]|nr:M14 family zinc carboxypeptidase [Flavobacteriaceae bacterium]